MTHNTEKKEGGGGIGILKNFFFVFEFIFD